MNEDNKIQLLIGLALVLDCDWEDEHDTLFDEITDSFAYNESDTLDLAVKGDFLIKNLTVGARVYNQVAMGLASTIGDDWAEIHEKLLKEFCELSELKEEECEVLLEEVMRN